MGIPGSADFCLVVSQCKNHQIPRMGDGYGWSWKERGLLRVQLFDSCFSVVRRRMLSLDGGEEGLLDISIQIAQLFHDNLATMHHSSQHHNCSQCIRWYDTINALYRIVACSSKNKRTHQRSTPFVCARSWGKSNHSDVCKVGLDYWLALAEELKPQ